MNAGMFFNPQGRMPHGQFMTAVLVLLAVSAVLSMMVFAGLVAYFVSFIPWIVVAYAWVAIWSKRLHNANVTGWMTILVVIGYFIVWMIISTGITLVLFPDALEPSTATEMDEIFAELLASARQSAIPTTIAGTITSWAFAFIVSLMLKNDPEDNQYGPAPA